MIGLKLDSNLKKGAAWAPFYFAAVLAVSLRADSASSPTPELPTANSPATSAKTATSGKDPVAVPKSSDAIYRFHLFKEPDSISPYTQRNSNAGYLLSQIQAPLLRWQQGKFQPAVSTGCRFVTSQDVRCQLRRDLKFSDGTPVRPEDWRAHFAAIFDPARQVRWAADLFDIVGAEELFTGQKNPPPLGVTATGTELKFRLKRPHREFLHRLTSPHLTPFRSTNPDKSSKADFAGLGAYRLGAWRPGVKFELAPNPFSFEGHPDRPRLEVLFVVEDSVALKLYQSGELQFLRRLPTAYIDQARGKPDYFEIDQVRFDYFGFTKKFRERPENRVLQQAMSLAFPFEEMRALYHAKPRPGCFGLPAKLSDGQVCFDEDPAAARQLLAGKKIEPIPALYSQSVDDHRRALEWLQLKLQSRAGLPLRLEGVETKTFLDRLDRRDASFFRRGVAPDRPTCAAVLENFLPGAAENYLDLDEKILNDAVPALLKESSETKKARLCREVLEKLRGDFVMIPTGPIFFSVLADPAFVGWDLNELNQLDLKDLHRK